MHVTLESIGIFKCGLQHYIVVTIMSSFSNTCILKLGDASPLRVNNNRKKILYMICECLILLVKQYDIVLYFLCSKELLLIMEYTKAASYKKGSLLIYTNPKKKPNATKWQKK